ncbi:MAG: adenylate/guanylate cyclase domain-containing protein [Actinomycetota bacterium]
MSTSESISSPSASPSASSPPGTEWSVRKYADAQLTERTRGWTLRRHIGVAFALITVVSIIGIGVLGFVEARQLINNEVEGRLSAVQDERVAAIERGLANIRSRTAVVANDPGVASSATRLVEAFGTLEDETLTEEQAAEVQSAFDDIVESDDLAARFTAVGLAPPTELTPLDSSSEYLLYHYVIAPDDDERSALADPGDGSEYSEVHAELHADLRAITDAALLDRMMLIRLDDSRVVYSTDKGLDVGASLQNQSIGERSLADALEERLLQVPSGQSIVLDFTPYVARFGEPVMFTAAVIRDGQAPVAVLVGEIPVSALNDVMNVGGAWELIGLEETGETYVVGSDGRLRSDVRGWIEDPEGYLDDLGDADEAAAIRSTGSTVFVQTVDTSAVRAALNGERFVGESTGPLGDDTLSVASTIDVAGLDWVVVADLETGEARQPLDSHLLRVLLAALLLAIVVAIASWWLARRMASPIAPLSEAAESIAAGDLDPPLDDRSADEFAHLGRQLRRFAGALAAERRALADQEAATEELLRSALPDRAVTAVHEQDLELGDLLDDVTVVVVMLVVGDSETGDIGPEAELLSTLVSDIETAAADHGLERVHSSVDHHVFLAGVGRPGVAAESAIEFAVEVGPLVSAVADDTGNSVRHGIAMSSGPAATGVVDPVGLTYSVWGRPAREALELAIGGDVRGGVILHPSTIDALPAATGDSIDREPRSLGDDEVEVGVLRAERTVG